MSDAFQIGVGVALLVSSVLGALAVGVVARLRYRAALLVAVAAGVTLFVGAFIAGLAVAHLVGVIWTRVYIYTVFVWDFRFSGLLLVGITLVTGAMILMSSALGLGRGRTSAWRRAVGSTLWLLLVTAVVWPVQQDLAGGVLMAAGVELGLLIITRTKLSEPMVTAPGQTPARSTPPPSSTAAAG